MATIPEISERLTARQFAEALFAGLAADHHTEIKATQLQLHKAFRTLMNEVEVRHDLTVDLSEVDYDPLYGLSGWLDEFLARAQRDLMIGSPNPSYGRIDIKVSPREGEEMLAPYTSRTLLQDLSRRFYRQLSE